MGMVCRVNKKWLYLSITFIIASMALNFPFPHESPYGETIVSVFNIPVRSAKGFHYVGITSFVLLITGLYFLTKSVKKHQGRFLLIAILITLFAPSWMVSSFQKTLATGIYAVSYERDLSSCKFDMIDDKTLHGECELPFENYSKGDVQFTVEFYDKYYFEDEVQMVSLMNNNAPYEVKLKGKERKNVKIEMNMDVSNIDNHIESGTMSSVNIMIKSGKSIRKL
jgi:hypothetical protein